MIVQIALVLFLLLTGVLTLFQLALAFGAPLGKFAMGGNFPGKYPVKMRIASVVQIAIYLLIAAVVVSRAGLAFFEIRTIATFAVWIVAILLGLGVVMNLLSKSIWEKIIWTPVALVMFISVVIIALS